MRVSLTVTPIFRHYNTRLRYSRQSRSERPARCEVGLSRWRSSSGMETQFEILSAYNPSKVTGSEGRQSHQPHIGFNLIFEFIWCYKTGGSAFMPSSSQDRACNWVYRVITSPPPYRVGMAVSVKNQQVWGSFWLRKTAPSCSSNLLYLYLHNSEACMPNSSYLNPGVVQHSRGGRLNISHLF